MKRLSPREASASIGAGARLVDIRPWPRGSTRARSREREATDGQTWIVFCSEGYTSSIAADTLRSIGVDATDVIGGFRAWQAAGLPTIAGGTQPVGAPRQ